MGGYAFISYSRTDRAYAEQLADHLNNAGITCWYDHELIPGDRWEQVIRAKVDACAVFVLVMTPDADESRWVKRELTRAEEGRRPIVPLLLRGGCFFGLSDLQFEDVTGGRMPTARTVSRLSAMAAMDEDDSFVPQPAGCVTPSATGEGDLALSKAENEKILVDVLGDACDWAVQVGRIGRVDFHAQPVALMGAGTRLRVGVVPPRADGFQDRDVLTALGCCVSVSSDQEGLSWLLSGLGGVGKTQLAAEYARNLWKTEAVDVLVWVAASTREAIVSGYAAALTELTGVDLDDERAARRWLAWLAVTDRQWLVVLDDVQDPADLCGLWPPQTMSGRVLVTTRRRDAALRGDRRRVIEVGLFTPDEAAAFLLHRLSRCPRQSVGAPELARELGYLPLALSHAAAYIADHPALTCASYVRLFTSQHATLQRLFPECGCVPDDYQRTVATTWTLSTQLANRLAPAGLAEPLLALASVLDPNGIPDRLFRSPGVLGYLTATVDQDVDAATAIEALSCPHRLNLITHNPAATHHAVRVHALVQRATRDALTPDQLTAVTHAAADALLSIWPDVDQDTVLAAALRANTSALTSVGAFRWRCGLHPLLFRAGTSLGESGQATAAVRYYHQLAAGVAPELGADHPDTLAIRHEIADWHGEAGDPASAATAFEELLADWQRVLGRDHRCTLATRHEIARWRGEAGDPVAAVTAFQQLLADDLRVLGPDDRNTLTTRHNLLYWRVRAGMPVNIMDLEALLVHRLRVLGPDHPDTLATRHNLARWHGETGDPQRAATTLRNLLSDRLRVLGVDHPDTLATRHEITRWYGEAGNPASAANMLLELLIDRLRVLGPDHPDTLATRHNLARWHGEAGDPQRAATTLGNLLSDNLRILGPSHPLTLTIRKDLSYWQRKSHHQSTRIPVPRSTAGEQFGARSIIAMRRSGR